MFYADTVGLKTVLARIGEFRRRHGDDLWSPAPLLRRLAETGGTFTNFDRQKEFAAGV
jgi:3-hydroxyacyl-CoA dehydrogenase